MIRILKITHTLKKETPQSSAICVRTVQTEKMSIQKIKNALTKKTLIGCVGGGSIGMGKSFFSMFMLFNIFYRYTSLNEIAIIFFSSQIASCIESGILDDSGEYSIVHFSLGLTAPANLPCQAPRTSSESVTLNVAIFS